MRLAPHTRPLGDDGPSVAQLLARAAKAGILVGLKDGRLKTPNGPTTPAALQAAIAVENARVVT